MASSIDKVTVSNFNLALRMCGIELHEVLLDKIIDVVELLAEKGDQAAISDIVELKQRWRDDPAG